MTYSEFLFSQLFYGFIETNDTEYEQLEYDIIFPIIVEHYKKYISSIYNDDNKGEYACMLDYIYNTIKIKQHKKIKPTLSELEEMAVELLEFGDSKEKAMGRGMMRVIKELL